MNFSIFEPFIQKIWKENLILLHKGSLRRSCIFPLWNTQSICSIIFHYFEKKQQPRMLVTWQLTSLCIPSLDLLYLFTTILLSLRFFMLWWFRSSINCLLVEVIYTHDAKARYSVSLSLVWQIWPVSHSTTLSFLYLHYAIWIDESHSVGMYLKFQKHCT